MNGIDLTGPFPSRKASRVLRDRLIHYLASSGASAGSPFFSDAQLMEKSGLSRTTVRKAVDELSMAGWVERRAGVGTFVGPRAEMPRPVFRSGGNGGGRDRLETVRVGVLLHLHAAGGVDFFTRGVLQGLDSAAAEHRLSVELVGDYNACIRTLSKRLERDRADVLIVMPATARHAMQAGAAEALGIPCLLAGSHLHEAGLPVVQEDGEQGAELAVRHLLANGHRRIGLWLSQVPAIWAHQRRNGFLRALQENGVEPDERLVFWTPYSPVADAACRAQLESVPALDAYLREQRPTALILGSSGQHTHTLGEWLNKTRTRVPEELSLVCFDQNYGDYAIFLHRRPTVVALPLYEMGRALARLAREAHAAAMRGVSSPPAFVTLPCTLVDGDSVARPREGVRRPAGRR